MHDEKETKLSSIERVLQDHGGHVARIPAREIVVDPRVRLKCLVPVCDSYNRGLMCPPNLPMVNEFQEALRLYNIALLVQYRQFFVPERERHYADVFGGARKLHFMINLGEKEAFRLGFRFAAGLIGGACHLCDECVGIASGKPCRHPFEARPSMEAMGIDVVATAEKAGLSLRFPVSDEVVWNGLLLID
ncbi:MAG: DUF2284 domain-containing protein [Syntrophothermus sp.]|uniref:DUF2284 domain-containing protein n=1 Tax=Syntrophothermus sp. TaxID=2736299 RepID=UPI0025802280|nr:DUF2284 domain-containing protein [Syntrophothermus sp.]NSW81971.1 DUF2284 domain-containing protein [Syntrophothermus sp.]